MFPVSFYPATFSIWINQTHLRVYGLSKKKKIQEHGLNFE